MRTIITLSILYFFAVSADVFAGEVHSYTFGVVPQQAATVLAKTWIPFLSYLEEKSGVSLHFKTDSSIPKFEHKLAHAEYDIAYMNPYHYVQFHNKAGYRAFAKAKNKLIKGIIVIPRDSNIQHIEDLQGQAVAFPAPLAFAASILPQAYFKSAGININPVYVNSHDSVYANVAIGHYPAGGGVIRTFKDAPLKYTAELKVLWTTKGYTPHAFAALSSVKKNDILKIQQAMIDMDNNARGKQLLRELNIGSFSAADNADWDDVRELSTQTSSK